MPGLSLNANAAAWTPGGPSATPAVVEEEEWERVEVAAVGAPVEEKAGISSDAPAFSAKDEEAPKAETSIFENEGTWGDDDDDEEEEPVVIEEESWRKAPAAIKEPEPSSAPQRTRLAPHSYRREAEAARENGRGHHNGNGRGGLESSRQRYDSGQQQRPRRNNSAGHLSNNGDASPGTPKEYQKPAWARRGEDEALKKAKSILNKLTLEKFDRLSEEFVNLDLDSVDLVAGAIDLIVKKAQRETHFVDIYAELCVKLAATPLAGLGETEKGKKFRKLLLERCQAEFERDDEALVAEINGISDDAEREARITSIRKIYIGHIFFIGALYKQELLRETIMHHCVQELFGDPDEPDDEKIECLSKLMMSVGKQLDAAALEKKESQRFMKAYFKQLKKLTKSDKLATRIRFLVRDLCDLRDNDWKPRREVEQAKTIAEIHEDAQREADVKAGKKPTARKVERAGNTVSDDGWETVGKSVPAASKSGSRYGSRNAAVEKASPDPVPAASGAFGAFASLSSSKEKKKKKKKDEKEVKQPKKKSSSSTAAAPPTAPAPEVDETKYRAKAKAAVQEYLSIEQIDEVVSCLEELNGPRSLFVSQALDCMLNCKERDRAKVGPLLGQLAKRNVLSPDDFAKGFLDILQILPDIIIDMPKANYWLGDALITLVKDGALNLDFVTKDVPEPIAQGGDDYVKVWDDFKAYVVNGCDA